MGKLSVGSLLAVAFLLGGAPQSFGADAFCGAPIPASKELVKAITQRAPLGAFAGNGRVSPLLEGIEPQIFNGDVNEHQGSVLFIKQNAKWSLVAPKDGEHDEGLFVSAQSDDVFIVTMLATEGPGSDYTLVRADGKFARFDCLTIPFPDAIHSPEEYLELADFNIDAHGNGKLTGSATIDRGGPRQVWWFQYSTSDHGRSWSAPVRLPGKPAKTSGIFKAAATGPNKPLQRQMEHYFGVH